MCIKKVLNSLKHLVVTNKMITFASEISNGTEDNFLNNYKYGKIRFLSRPTR